MIDSPRAHKYWRCSARHAILFATCENIRQQKRELGSLSTGVQRGLRAGVDHAATFNRINDFA